MTISPYTVRFGSGEGCAAAGGLSGACCRAGGSAKAEGAEAKSAAPQTQRPEAIRAMVPFMLLPYRLSKHRYRVMLHIVDDPAALLRDGRAAVPRPFGYARVPFGDHVR